MKSADLFRAAAGLSGVAGSAVTGRALRRFRSTLAGFVAFASGPKCSPLSEGNAFSTLLEIVEMRKWHVLHADSEWRSRSG